MFSCLAVFCDMEQIWETQHFIDYVSFGNLMSQIVLRNRFSYVKSGIAVELQWLEPWWPIYFARLALIIGS